MSNRIKQYFEGNASTHQWLKATVRNPRERAQTWENVQAWKGRLVVSFVASGHSPEASEILTAALNESLQLPMRDDAKKLLVIQAIHNQHPKGTLHQERQVKDVFWQLWQDYKLMSRVAEPFVPQPVHSYPYHRSLEDIPKRHLKNLNAYLVREGLDRGFNENAVLAGAQLHQNAHAYLVGEGDAYFGIADPEDAQINGIARPRIGQAYLLEGMTSTEPQAWVRWKQIV
jgi:hypothetical protein